MNQLQQNLWFKIFAEKQNFVFIFIKHIPSHTDYVIRDTLY
jgi:hypothetical protein